MKKMLIGLLMLSIFSVMANERNIVCQYDGGGYDDEYITAKINDGGFIKSLIYESYQGEVGPFKASDNGYFEHTTNSLKLRDTISFASDLKAAVLVTSYKNHGSIFSVQHFSCKTE